MADCAGPSINFPPVLMDLLWRKLKSRVTMEWGIPYIFPAFMVLSSGAPVTMRIHPMMRTTLQGLPEWLVGPRQMIGVLLVLVCLFNLASGQSTNQDRVEEFRKALLIDDSPLLDNEAKELADEYRRKNLTKLIKEIPSLGDRSQLLLLPGWSSIRPVDLEVRKELIKEFVSQIKNALKDSDPAVVTAACFVISQPFTKSDNNGGETQSDLRDALNSLQKDLTNLATSPNPDIKAAMALTLAKIKPKLSDFLVVLKPLIQPGQSLLVRRAAIEGIEEYVSDFINELTKVSKVSNPLRNIEVDFKAVGQIVRLLGATTAVGVADPDPTIQKNSLKALQKIAFGCRDGIPDPLNPRQEGRKLTAQEKEELQQTGQKGLKIVNDYLIVLRSFRESESNLYPPSISPDPSIQTPALHILENITISRTKLRRYKASLPKLVPEELPKPMEDTKPGNKDAKRELHGFPINSDGMSLITFVQVGGSEADIDSQLLEESDTQLQTITAVIKGPFPIDQRLLAMGALEAAGSQALKVEPVLVAALCDSNNFIRWAAARTLGKLGPKVGENSIQGLIPLLQDLDVEIRQAAAAALEKVGEKAEPAINALIEVVSRGDPEVRIAAMKTLAAIGPRAASSIMEIATNLTDTNKSVRSQAALVLGRFGPLAIQAAPALRANLADIDHDVRRNASNALIKILGR